MATVIEVCTFGAIAILIAGTAHINEETLSRIKGLNQVSESRHLRNEDEASRQTMQGLRAVPKVRLGVSLGRREQPPSAWPLVPAQVNYPALSFSISKRAMLFSRSKYVRA